MNMKKRDGSFVPEGQYIKIFIVGHRIKLQQVIVVSEQNIKFKQQTNTRSSSKIDFISRLILGIISFQENKNQKTFQL